MTQFGKAHDKPGAIATGHRSLSPALGALLLFIYSFGLEASAQAATPPRIDEKGIRIGLPDGPDVARSRNGVWTPVAVPLKVGSDDVPRDSYRLIVETTDGEGVPYRYSAPVPDIPSNSSRLIFLYVRPGRTGASFTVALQQTDGADVQTVERLSRDPSKAEVLEPRQVLFLTLGPPLRGLQVASKPEEGEQATKSNKQGERVSSSAFASIENIAHAPDRWFGYEAVDAIIITTSSDAFVEQLLEMDEARRDALLEWVQRGGKLVLSVGRNPERVSRWLEKMPLVDGKVQSKILRPSLPNLQMWCGADPRKKQPLRNIEIACIQPGPNMAGMVHEIPSTGDPEIRPILWESSCGLGRVLLVAFDLDAPPFSTWDGQSSFWKKLQEEIAPRLSFGETNVPAVPVVEGGELAVDLKRELESFREVPVIPFGWVAIIMLFYIGVIGPLDYLVLKKLFKRLELTWITFPALVLIVSVAAYATAYYFKGDDLQINKIDLVDIDMHGRGQVYGQSWLTLFSPRIQNYTIGLEPTAPDWGGRGEIKESDALIQPVLVATMDGPEPGLGGNTQSLFRRPYQYAPDANRLLNVPIPMWATRTFTASWHIPLQDGQLKDHPPPIQAELRISRDSRAVSGAFTNNLPVELQGTVLFFQGHWYLLGDVAPGETREVAPLFEPDVKPHSLQEWFFDSKVLQPQRMTSPPASLKILRALLFHGAPGGGQQPNSGLRQLDEGWRVLSQGEGQQRRFRDEVILVARTPTRRDRADAILQSNISPARLWLGEFPSTRERPSAIDGYLQQETYVRIYIPLIRHP